MAETVTRGDHKRMHQGIRYLTAIVWISSGLFCKVLYLVPRHKRIVARILGEEYAGALTITIGVAEVCMAIWILTAIKRRLNAVVQMILVALMNILEFILAPDLLLFGKGNALFAMIFILFIYFNEFVLPKRQ